jgi:hypothetical protein
MDGCARGILARDGPAMNVAHPSSSDVARSVGFGLIRSAVRPGGGACWMCINVRDDPCNPSMRPTPPRSHALVRPAESTHQAALAPMSWPDVLVAARERADRETTGGNFAQG